MLIQCPLHGETEAYDSNGYAGKCRLCHCEHTKEQRRRKAAGEITARVYVKEQPQFVAGVRGDPWLTCNQPGCHKVCADRHDLYLHKTSAHGLNVGPEQRSLIQSTLRQA